MRQTILTAAAACCGFLAVLTAALFLPQGSLEPRLTLLFKLLTLLLGFALFAVLLLFGRRRQLQNERIRYNHSLFCAITENLDEGIAVLTGADRLEVSNARFLQLLDIKSPADAGCSAADILPENIYRFTAEARRTSGFGSGPPASQIVAFGQAYLNVHVFPLSGTGRTGAYALILQDCTKYILMEENLTGQLEEAHHRMDAKASFLANVSHELKTPLNAIFGLNHILEETELDDYQRELVSKIGISSDCLNERINDMLDLSELKKGSFHPKVSSFRLQDMMDSLYSKYSRPAAHKHILLMENYHFEPELCICLDRSRVEQILSNLIGNACKFTEVGYVRISVSVLQESKSSVTLKFVVEDTGIGILEEEIPNIFKDFYQSENYLTKQYQGTGIGLPICKYLAEKMGGTLNAKSRRGLGSSFIFTITAPKHPIEAEEALSSPLDLQGHGEKVLVVEDAPLNYEVVSTLLAKVNIACHHAASGPEALSICEEAGDHYYKAIFMDIHMPVMDGYETARRLKKMGYQTPIIALTATSMDAKTQRETQDLFCDFVFKPFKYTQLYNALSPYIDSLPPVQDPCPAPPAEQDSEASIDARETGSQTMDSGSHVRKTKLPYIGRDIAIENMGGSRELYEKHLTKFKKTYAGSCDQLRDYLKEGDRIEAKRLAHSVKGLAATLGLAQLARSAEILEFAITDGIEHLQAEVDAFDGSLAKALED